MVICQITYTIIKSTMLNICIRILHILVFNLNTFVTFTSLSITFNFVFFILMVVFKLEGCGFPEPESTAMASEELSTPGRGNGSLGFEIISDVAQNGCEHSAHS